MCVRQSSRKSSQNESKMEWRSGTIKSPSKNDIDIDVDPEIAEVFHRSNAVSSKCSYSFILFKLFGSYIASKGVSAKLLQKGSKRRRTKQQIEDEKQASFLKEQ